MLQVTGVPSERLRRVGRAIFGVPEIGNHRGSGPIHVHAQVARLLLDRKRAVPRRAAGRTTFELENASVKYLTKNECGLGALRSEISGVKKNHTKPR